VRRFRSVEPDTETITFVLGITWDGGPKALWIGFICGLAVAAILLNGRFDRVTRRLMNG